MAETEVLPSAPVKKKTTTSPGTKAPDSLFAPAPTTPAPDTDEGKKKVPDTTPKTDTGDKPPKKVDGDEGDKPKVPGDDSDAGDKLPQPDEEGKYTATLVNRQQDVEKRIREEAQEQLRKASTELQWWRFIKKAKFKWGEDYYVNRGIKMLREAVIENNNVFVDMDVITSEASKVRQRFRRMTRRAPITVDRYAGRDQLRDQDAHKSEARAKLEQISLGQQIGETDSKFQQVEEASKPLKDLMATEIFKPIMSGTIQTEEQLQDKLRDFVNTHTGETADPAIKAQLDKMFGQAATEFNERAQMFAANFLEIGQAMARDERAHGTAMENIGDKIRINLANTEWAASTQVEMNWADRRATKLKSTKYGRYLNETTVGALASIGGFVGVRLFAKGSSAALGAVGVGALTGAILGAHERSRNLKKDIATHRARTEYGQKVDTTRDGSLKDKLDMDKKLEEFRYQHIASVDDLLNNDGSRPRTSDESDPRGLHAIMEAFDAAPNDPAAREAMIRRISEIQSRLLFSADKGAGFIDFGDRRATEHGRLELVKGVAEAKKKLVDAMVSQGETTDNAKVRMNRLLSTARDGWQNTWSEDKTQQDKAFASYRRRSAATHGAIGAATGALTALGVQQVIAEGGHLINNLPITPTILENAGLTHSHSVEHQQAIMSLQESLKSHNPTGIESSFGELGIGVHAQSIPGEANERIIIDTLNGVKVDAPLPPTLTYNPDTQGLTFAGNVPDEVRAPFEQILKENYFNVGETHMGTEAMQANQLPHMTEIPGTKLQVSLPGGAELAGPPGGPFDIVTLADDGGTLKLATGLQFDAQGHRVQGVGEILRPDILQLGKETPGPEVQTNTKEWMEKYSSGKGIDQWYGNNTRESNLNELRAYNYRSESGNGVTFDMSNMKFASWQEGNVPYSFDVQHEIHEGNAVMALWEKGNPDKVDVLIKMPEDGKVTFDWNSQQTLSVFKDGDWKDMPASEVSKMFLAEDLRDFKTSSEVNPQYRDLFNRNFSMGVMSDKDGEQVFSSFATGFGRGETPPTIGSPSVVENFVAVQQTEIAFPDTWEPIPVALPIVPRRHLGEAESTEAPIPFKPEGLPVEYYGYYGGAIDPRVKEWLEAHKSETLKNDPKAELDPYKEAQMYFDKQDPAYKAEIAALAESVPPLSKDVKAVICIPVAGHQEGKQIFDTLENYTNQTAPNNSFEVQLFVNRPETDLQGNPTSSKETLDAIAAFQAKYPDFPLRIIEKTFPPAEANIGRIRKYGADIALYRQMQRGEGAGDVIIISNDADNKGVVPRYVQTFIDRFDKDPHAEAMLGQLDWDPEAYSQYPVIHIGTRLFQYLNIIGRHRSGRMVSSGANSAFRGSAYAAIGGYVMNLEGGEDIAIGRSIISARGDDYTRLTHATPARLYTSARRAVDALQKGLPPVDQWRKGFSAFDDEVRGLELGTEANVDYDDPAQVAKLKEGLEWVINTTIDMYEDGEQLGKDNEYYKNAMRYMGIRYNVVDGEIKITNMDTVARNLKHYREIAVLQRDIISGKGGQAAKDRLRQLNEQFELETNSPVDADGSPLEPKEVPGIEDRLERFNASVDVRLSNVPKQKYELADLEQSDKKHEFGDFVICSDMILSKEKSTNIVAGYNKSTGEVIAFKLSEQPQAGAKEPWIENEEYIKTNVQSPIFFTYQQKFADGDRTVRAYPIMNTDLEGYIEANGKLDSQHALGMMIHLGQGLRELHQRNRGHNDVAASNVLVAKDGLVFLGDFDDIVHPRDIVGGKDFSGGNVFIRPPELYENNFSSIENIDTYEAATLLYQSVVGNSPFLHVELVQDTREENTKRRRRYYEAKKNEDYTIPDEVPDAIKAIIRRGLDPDPKKRYQSMDQMLNDMLNAYEQINRPAPPPSPVGGTPGGPRPPAPPTPDGGTPPEPPRPPVPPSPEDDRRMELNRNQGRTFQEGVEERGLTLAGQQQYAARLLNRPLTDEEREMVRSDRNWGEKFAERRYRENSRPTPPAPPGPPAPPAGGTETGTTTVESAVPLVAADSMRDTLNQTIAEGGNRHTFEVAPDVLAAFIQEHPTLLGDGMGVESLNARVVNGRIELSGNLLYNGDRRVILNRAVLQCTPEGELQLAGRADYTFPDSGRLGSYVRTKAANVRGRNIDDRMRLGLNGQIDDENWGVERFTMMNGNLQIAVSNAPEVRQRLSTAYTGGTETTAPPSSATVAPPTSESGAFAGGTETAEVTPVEPLATSEVNGNVVATIQSELQRETADTHGFLFDANALSRFIMDQANQAYRRNDGTGIFGGSREFTDLQMQVAGNRIIVSGNYHVRNRGDIALKKAVLVIDEHGMLTQEGAPRIGKKLFEKRIAPDGVDMQFAGDQLAWFLNEQIPPGWQSQSFDIIDDKLALIMDFDEERIPTPPDTSAEATVVTTPVAPRPAVPSVPTPTGAASPAGSEATGAMPPVSPEATGAMPPPGPLTTPGVASPVRPPATVAAPVPTATGLTPLDSEATGEIPRVPEQGKDVVPEVGERFTSPNGKEFVVQKIRYTRARGIRPSTRAASRQPEAVVLRAVGGRETVRQDYWDFRYDVNNPEGAWRVVAPAAPEAPQTVPQAPELRGERTDLLRPDHLAQDMATDFGRETENDHTFAIEPQTLAQYLEQVTNQGADTLLGQTARFHDLKIEMDNGRLVVSGAMNVNGTLDFNLDRVAFEIGADGLLVPVQPYNLEQGDYTENPTGTIDPGRADMLRVVANTDIQNFGRGLQLILNNQLQSAGVNWTINRFQQLGNAIGLQAARNASA